MTTPCEQLADIISSSFSEVLERLGFRIVEEQPLGNNGCSMLFESDHLRLNIFLGDGEVNIRVGDRAAPWDKANTNSQDWLYIWPTAAYLESDPSLGTLALDSQSVPSVEEQARNLAEVLHRHLKSLSEVSAEDRFSELQKKILAFSEIRRGRIREQLHDYERSNR